MTATHFISSNQCVNMLGTLTLFFKILIKSSVLTIKKYLVSEAVTSLVITFDWP